jgi:hypothetical protein
MAARGTLILPGVDVEKKDYGPTNDSRASSAGDQCRLSRKISTHPDMVGFRLATRKLDHWERAKTQIPIYDG